MSRRLAILLLPLVLAACSGGPSLEALDPPEPLREFAPRLAVEPRWNTQLGSGVGRHFLRLPPLLDAGQVYLADRRGRVAAYAARSGQRLWRTELETPLSGGPGDGDELLLLGGSAEVIALDKGSGTLRWRAPVSSEVLTTPVRSGAVVVVRTVDGKLIGLDSLSGRRLWSYQQEVPLLSLRGTSTPRIEGDIVVSGFANGRLAALKLHDGRLLWESVIAVPKGRTELERLVDIDAQLEISGGVVYVATYQGRIAAVSLDGGRLLWGREFSSYSGIALAGRMLYVSDARGDLWALERNSGGTLWKQDALHGRGLSMPVLQGDAVVVGDYEGYLHWLDREDGHLLARARVEDWQAYYPIKDEFYNDNAYREDRMVLAAPRASGDWLYAVDKRGVLNAYQIRPLPAEG